MDEYKYLVANPFGVFLVRCKTMPEVRVFVKQHLARTQDAYYTLVRQHLKASDYQVRDLTEIPILTGAKKYGRSHEECCDCTFEKVDPQPCPGHPAGPVSCICFTKKEKTS
jgi:hypothetical protein